MTKFLSSLKAYLQFAPQREHLPWIYQPSSILKVSGFATVSSEDDRYTDEIEDRYGEVRCPVTIIWGEQDEWISYKRGQTLAERIPNAGFHLISGASHLVQEDAPEAIVAIVLNFLPKTQ